MAIDLEDLDDKTYDELVAEARAALPVLSPAWTDHNPSDPGIALVELFAWLTEMLVYRTGRVDEKSRRAFLRLLADPGDAALRAAVDAGELDAATRATLAALRARHRAVTLDDYEHLAITAWPETPEARALGAAGALRRVRAIAGTPPHVGLLVLPDTDDRDRAWDPPEPRLLEKLVAFFDDRRLITTRLFVAGPRFLPVQLRATLHLRSDARAADVEQAATLAVARWLHPWDGGADGRGWPFGRAVHASEAYAVLEAVRGVDFADGLDLRVEPADAARREVEIAADGAEEIVRVTLSANELPRLTAVAFDLMERVGDEWATVRP
jgi:phage-related baseplate assembly protein